MEEKTKGECFSSSNSLKLFNVWLRRRKKGPSVVVAGRCPWCWNEVNLLQSVAKVLLLTVEALWCHQKCCQLQSHYQFSLSFFFLLTNAAFLFSFVHLQQGIERPFPSVSSWESHFPCTCDSAVKQAQWNLNGKRPECILIHYRWFVTHIAVMCFCRSFCACVCVCIYVCVRVCTKFICTSIKIDGGKKTF